jgi:hypothetical protein
MSPITSNDLPGLNAHRPGRTRPAVLQALGADGPPSTIEVNGAVYQLGQIFKHDSWAATARYDGPRGSLACKFNRIEPVLGVPMGWVGRWLARREANFFHRLNGVPGIPTGYPVVRVAGRIAPTAFAHDFVPGQPLSLVHQSSKEFFDQLSAILDAIHSRHMAYVDLNKPENVLVGDDGRPYLFDFQISIRLPKWPGCCWIMRILQSSDRYHLNKHRIWRLHRSEFADRMRELRPWWIRWHRAIGVPLRTLRRQILVWLGVRRGHGAAHTEVAPEHGLCTPEKIRRINRAA